MSPTRRPRSSAGGSSTTRSGATSKPRSTKAIPRWLATAWPFGSRALRRLTRINARSPRQARPPVCRTPRTRRAPRAYGAAARRIQVARATAHTSPVASSKIALAEVDLATVDAEPPAHDDVPVAEDRQLSIARRDATEHVRGRTIVVEIDHGAARAVERRPHDPVVDVLRHPRCRERLGAGDPAGEQPQSVTALARGPAGEAGRERMDGHVAERRRPARLNRIVEGNGLGKVELHRRGCCLGDEIGSVEQREDRADAFHGERSVERRRSPQASPRRCRPRRLRASPRCSPRSRCPEGHRTGGRVRPSYSSAHAGSPAWPVRKAAPSARSALST